MAIISHWKLIDLTDEEGLHNLTNQGADQVADGYDFDGGTEYMTVTDTGNDYDFIANEGFTIVVWAKIRPGQEEGTRLFAKYSGTYGYEITITNAGNLKFSMKSSGSYLVLQSDNTWDDNAWHMFAFRRLPSSTTIKLWVDDGIVENKSGIGDNGTLANALALHIGKPAHVSGYEFNGIIGNGSGETRGIMIYDNALIDADLQALYEGVSGWTGKISGVTNPGKVNPTDVTNIASINGVQSS